jgi:hypothetical protein
MSGSTVAIVVEAAALAVVVLFLVALLRSHAEILRRLAVLEGDGGEGWKSAPSDSLAAAPEIVGETLEGDAVKVALDRGAPYSLLAFLSSGCAWCEPFWTSLAAAAPLPPETRLLIVTKGPEAESLAALHELVAPGVEAVMSTAAWRAFSVPSSPHFVLVDGRSGEIAGRGSATTWEQLLRLVTEANSDGTQHAQRAEDSASRARRAHEALASAGIRAGHPSLYPSRAEPPGDSSP